MWGKDVNPDTGVIQKTKQTRLEKSFPLPYCKQTAKYTEQRQGFEGEKHKATYEGRPLRLATEFSTETSKARRAGDDAFQNLKDSNCQPRLLYSAKLFVISGRESKICYDKSQFKNFVPSKSAFQRMLEGIPWAEEKDKHIHEAQRGIHHS